MRIPSTGAHNRWHPELEPVARVAPGDVVTLETRDGLDGQLTRASTHVDCGRFDDGRAHPLTGPVFVNGAEPGDVLEVELPRHEERLGEHVGQEAEPGDHAVDAERRGLVVQ